jgi:hypothetical protein
VTIGWRSRKLREFQTAERSRGTAPKHTLRVVSLLFLAFGNQSFPLYLLLLKRVSFFFRDVLYLFDILAHRHVKRLQIPADYGRAEK